MIRVESTRLGRLLGVKIYNSKELKTSRQAGRGWTEQLNLPYVFNGDIEKARGIRLAVKCIVPIFQGELYVGEAGKIIRDVAESWKERPGEVIKGKEYHRLAGGEAMVVWEVLRICQLSDQGEEYT